MKRLEIGIGRGVKGALREFAQAWKRAERGERQPEAATRIEFSAMGELLAVLTPRRLELIECVAREPGLSIRALAKSLDRDYKRVHGDVTALSRFGLVERDDQGGVRAPYDELVIRAPLKAAA